MTDESRYTLTEAKRKLIEAECATHGHARSVISPLGSNVPRAVTCTRCGQTHEVVVATSAQRGGYVSIDDDLLRCRDRITGQPCACTPEYARSCSVWSRPATSS